MPRGDLETWQRLLASMSLEVESSTVDPGNVAQVARLRRDYDPVLVTLALDLWAARRKAAKKWPGRSIVADPEGVEMATPALVGAHKADRLATAGEPIVDLCCGVGGDAMQLVGAGAEVTGVDADEVRAWMCERNARCRTVVADVTTYEFEGRYHFDPSRRVEGRRLWRYEDVQPGPAFIERLAERDGAVKLGPGVDVNAPPPGELEFIAVDNALNQAVLWTGDLAESARRATVLPSGVSISGDPGPAPTAPAGAFIHAVNPAVERAELMGVLADSLGCGALHPRLGLLTSDAPESSRFVTSFELHARMPWRLRRVKAWLRDHDGAIVAVKTRDKVVDPDRVQAELDGPGSTVYTVFVLRFGSAVEALITTRVWG